MIGAFLLIVVLLIIGFVLGINYRKKVAEKEMSSAEEEAKRIINEGIKSAENKKREALLEAKEEIHKNRSELEREVRERRSELSKQERRLQQKEENLDKKTDHLDKKTEALNEKMAAVEAQKEEVAKIKRGQMEMLEKISGYSIEEAKNYLIESVRTECTHEMASAIKEVEAQYKEESESLAREIIATAIQRCAADHASEVTVSVVQLPNDEMKGRIIGREGRNIRSIEQLTGCDLIIDDTPETITVSSFDPVRREVARIALEKLIQDGRIHPARIEEMVAKAQKEVNATIKAEGERAVFETGVNGLHPEIIKLLGRMKYRTSYGQNVLNHSIEVAHISGLIASELGENIATAKRAGLLHDLGKSIDHEVEGSHVTIGAELARRYKESNDVVHAIEAHHNDVEPHTIIACIVQAADAISASRPGARRENIENYVKRLEKLEEIAKSFHGIDECYAIQAGREIRVMVSPDKVTEDETVLLARDIAKKIESELTYPGQIKVHIIRETKAVDYAK
jgi:ribonuclease Y